MSPDQVSKEDLKTYLADHGILAVATVYQRRIVLEDAINSYYDKDCRYTIVQTDYTLTAVSRSDGHRSKLPSWMGGYISTGRIE